MSTIHARQPCVARNWGAELTPSALLAANTTYRATIRTGAQDLAGNALAQDFTWSFTTGAAAAQGPNPVNLGGASSETRVMDTSTGNSWPSA